MRAPRAEPPPEPPLHRLTCRDIELSLEDEGKNARFEVAKLFTAGRVLEGVEIGTVYEAVAAIRGETKQKHTEAVGREAHEWTI